MAPIHRLGVAVHELGGNEGPLLLLLHANGFHGRVFLPMMPIFAPHFRCVALDLPGHGSAPTPDAPFTADDLLGAVRDFVESHEIKDCYCFGHSLGGAMAALLQLERPQTFKAMFLFEPVIRPVQEGPQAPPSGGTPGAGARVGAGGISGAACKGSGSVGRGEGLATSSSGGCGPSPSLLLGTPASARSESVLARIARKRQAVFPSLEAAKSSLGSKAPFNSWHPQALHAYLACGGLRPLYSSSSSSSSSSAPAAPAAAAAAAAACLEFPPKASSAAAAATATATATVTASSAAAVAAATTASPLTLSCAPENEARVYEALDPPPWRPWQHLRTSFGANPKIACCSLGADNQGSVASGCDQGSRRSNKSSSNSHGGSSSSASTSRRLADDERHLVHRNHRGGRLAIAVGREVGLHAQLARWGAQVAELVPGASLIRFDSLHHLGPMEDPEAVATAALQFFRATDEDQPDSGKGFGGAAVADGSTVVGRAPPAGIVVENAPVRNPAYISGDADALSDSGTRRSGALGASARQSAAGIAVGVISRM